MATHIVSASGLRFDERHPLSGGSDSYFFRRVREMGYRMIWADQALVTEWVPKSRATLNWLAMRHFRSGATEFDGPEGSIMCRLRGAAAGLARLGLGASCAVALFPFGWHRFVKAIR
jgi:hypothetical protein